MRDSPHSYADTALLVTLGIALALAVVVAPIRFTPYADSAALRVGIAFVLAFLVVLVVRYVLLLWLSYLQHIENKDAGGGRREAGGGVTIIVPVYNEERVIEEALRSLLALRY